MNKVHCRFGDQNDIAFVLSCPGWEESEEGSPAAGQTGRNLEQLLRLLNSIDRRFPAERNDVTITNAWDRVEYAGKTGRSQPTPNEVIGAKNLKRLARELAHVRWLIVCCGHRASLTTQLASDLHNIPASIVFVPHLSTRGLNSITFDRQGSEITNASKIAKRLTVESNTAFTAALEQARAANKERRLDFVAYSIVKWLPSANT